MKNIEWVKGSQPLWVWAKPTSKAMQLVDLQSDLTYMYYDDKEGCYKQKFGTLQEFLQTFVDYDRLYIYTLNYESIKKNEERNERKI